MIAPNFLYKFKGIDEKIGNAVIELHSLKRLINDGYIYFNSYSQLNDPYEIWPSYKKLKPGEITKEKLNYIRAKYKRTESDEDMINFFKRPVEPSDIKIIRDNFAKYKFFCLSSTFSEPLLWSHYAEGHRGYAIIFDTRKLYKNILTQYLATHMDFLTYEINRPISYLFEDDKDIIDEMKEKLFRKYSKWDYEKEWRIVMESANEELIGVEVKIDKDCIKGIIIGPRSGHRAEIIDICKKNRITPHDSWINNEDSEFIVRSSWCG